MNRGWIGVDLDGTLAQYDHWRGADHIGEPVPLMVDRVKQWLKDGQEVRIFTARAYAPPPGSPSYTLQRDIEVTLAKAAIGRWCIKNIGEPLPVTCVKDFEMIGLYDDRCVQVEPNTGRLITDFVKRCQHEFTYNQGSLGLFCTKCNAPVD